MKLYGTTTSPYVRRVRIVAAEVGEPVELVDTFTDAGQAAMRAASPIWKVPAAELDGAVILDSHAIVGALLAVRGPGSLRPIPEVDRLPESNVHQVVDGALDSLINLFYLAKDGVTPEQSAYLGKQRSRAVSALTWLAGNLHAGYATARAHDDDGLGVTEISLVTALEWMAFRGTYPVSDHPALAEFLRVHADRTSIVATRPS